jgi:toluene monooxygenase system ferredoxin subunit
MPSNDSATLVWREVAMLDDVWEGETLEVEVDGQPVLVVHLNGGDIVAYQGVCPHQQIPLESGEIDEGAEKLTCSAHAWEFDLRDGTGINPTGCNLYRYHTRRDADTILVGYPEGDHNRHNQSKED